MKQNPMDEGRFSDHGEGLGTVTEDMVWRRAGEIAVMNGRSKKNILSSDVDQARRELQGEERLNPIPTQAETVPEGERWDPVPGTVGRKTPVVPPADEQTFAERLVEEGVGDAEHDQEVEATQESLRRERR